MEGLEKPDPHRPPRSLGRLFGDLKVRPKVIVLHNTFFLILAAAAYFSLIPLFEERVANAQLRENSLLVQIFSDDRPLPQIPGSEIYQLQEDTAEALQIPGEVRVMARYESGLDLAGSAEIGSRFPQDRRFRTVPQTSHARPVLCRHDRSGAADAFYRTRRHLYPGSDEPGVYYHAAIRLPADQDGATGDVATQEGDRAGELIPETEILDDEIGQIMRSRNATVAELRRHEDELAQTLNQLEQVAEDLRRKNLMLETAKKTLENQDRLASIGLLSASVAHEVNTPLTVLHGSIEKLIETAHDDHTRDRLARMLRVTQRLRKISESLVDFARVRKQEVESIELRPIIEEAWSLLAIDDKASGVHFTNLVSPDHRISGNTDRLIQVFLNLLRNSLNAIQSSGAIQVTSQIIDESENLGADCGGRQRPRYSGGCTAGHL